MYKNDIICTVYTELLCTLGLHNGNSRIRCGGEGVFSGVGGRMKGRQPWILALFVKILEGVLQTAH